MKSLLTALHRGRLFELHDNLKDNALGFLGTILQAVPELSGETSISEKTRLREEHHNTGIGKGWACPHAITEHDGELLCAVGWSPKGIDYGASDKVPVHLVVMYYVPESQRSAFLKEVSQLAKAIEHNADLQKLQEITDLSDVRHALLDAITHAIESAAPEARARMIQLEVRRAEIAATSVPPKISLDLIAASIRTVSILVQPENKPVVLTQDPTLVGLLENSPALAEDLAKGGTSVAGEITVVLRSSQQFAEHRVLHECIAFKTPENVG